MTGTTLYRHFSTQEAIDQAYDPALGVDMAAVATHFAGQARRAQQTLRYLPSVRYGPTLAETLEIFPADAPGAPVLLFIHGGYWRARSAREFSGVAWGPRALGMTVVSIDYALCPWVGIDEITRQARAALAWVHRHIAEYHGDPSRIAIAGHSAGANLAAMCLQTRWEEDYGLPADPIRAGALISGIYDIAPLRYSYLQPLLQIDDGVIARNSPMFGVRPSPAELLLSWGTRESSEFERQSTAFLEQWQNAGNRGALLPQEGANHFTALHGFEDAQSPLCQWLARVAF